MNEKWILLKNCKVTRYIVFHAMMPKTVEIKQKAFYRETDGQTQRQMDREREREREPEKERELSACRGY